MTSTSTMIYCVMHLRMFHFADFHQVALKVELTVDSTSSSMMRMDHLLDIDRKKTSLIFACNVSNNGSRMLEYSWIKDGVFLEDNVVFSHVMLTNVWEHEFAQFHLTGTKLNSFWC